MKELQSTLIVPSTVLNLQYSQSGTALYESHIASQEGSGCVLHTTTK